MNFYDKLYIGESIGNPKKVKRKLRHYAGQLSIYIVALASGSDQLEIYHCAFLKQKYYKTHPPFIVGICGSYDEAVDMVVQIAGRSLAKNGNADIKKFLFPNND